MKVETVAITALKPDDKNARLHSNRNIRAIAASLNEFGQRKPLVVYNDVVIAGNGTLEAAKSLNWAEISIARVPDNWTMEQARAYALADNRAAELAEWDLQALADQLAELDIAGFVIEDFGFTPLEAPTDPYVEWTGMPEFEQNSNMSDFKTIIHFRTETDANNFFELIERPKKASMWWPQNDGHVGSDVFQRYVADE